MVEMKLSTRTRYGVRALVDLALYSGQTPVQLKDIAEREDISEKYLEHIKKTEEDLKKEWREQAQKRIKFGLILRKISEKENLTPTEEMLDQKADEVLRSLPEEERKKSSKESLKNYLFGRLQNELVFDFLEKQK